MRPVVVFALYVWLAVSAGALIVQQIRRVRQRRAPRAQPAPEQPVPDQAAPTVVTQPDASVTPTAILERLAKPALPRARTLAETLAGIHLPCGLLPVVSKGVSTPENSVTLVTTSAPPEVVGPAIADELERLGYELDAVSASRLVARRHPDALTLDMILAPNQLERDGVALYPDLSPDAVLVVIATGDPSA